MKSAATAAPTRIDLAGGTLDIWPLYLVVEGAVTVNLAIRRPARARVTPRKDGAVVLRAAEVPAGSPLPLLEEIVRILKPSGGFTLSTRANVPRGSGLGGSSSLAVAAIRAVSLADGRPRTRSEIIRLAKDIEAAVLKVPTGTQDHLAAAYGGLAAIHLGPGGPEREVIRADTGALVRHLVLAVAGASRLSATTNWDMLKAVVDGHGEARERFADIAAAARAMRIAVMRRDLSGIGEAMERDYDARCGLAVGVETEEMRTLTEAAREAGALARKVCGAGGGGGMLFLSPHGRKRAISAALEAAGGVVLPFRADVEGLTR